MLISLRKCHQTGTMIEVVKDQLDVGPPELKYWTICQDHGGLVGHTTRKDAVGWAASPEDWCPTCQELRDAK